MSDYIVVNYNMLPYWVISAWVALSSLGIAFGLVLEGECNEKVLY